MKLPLVSIIIPTKNSGQVLEECLRSIKKQTYKKIETIVVDSYSTDDTLAICRKYKVKILQFNNRKLKGRFDATHKRNLGAAKARGDFVYYLDADMELTPNVVKQAVKACREKGFDAVIIKEVVTGKGFWTACRHLEQECYWGDDTVEAPRFFKKEVWQYLGGLDVQLGAACDDWDMYQRFLQKGFKATRIKAYLKHHEGELKLWPLFKKSFLYGKDALKFVKKNPKKGLRYFFPIRPAYLRHWRLFVKHPLYGLGLILIRIVEYSGGFLGIITSKFISNE